MVHVPRSLNGCKRLPLLQRSKNGRALALLRCWRPMVLNGQDAIFGA